MAIGALIISIVSALGAIAAVWVAVWTHRQQGSRVVCNWSNAYPAGASGTGERHIQVQAVNHRRSATTIAGWGFAIVDAQGKPTDRTIVSLVTLSWLPPLPHRLDSESSAGWMLPYADLWSVITSQPTQVTGILAFVRMGTGP
jgi:hypothetical protein